MFIPSKPTKVSVLRNMSILDKTYIEGIKNRHPNYLNDTLNVIASMISAPINPSKIENL